MPRTRSIRSAPVALSLRALVGISCLLAAATGCASFEPSNYRNWSPDQAKLPFAEIKGDLAHVHNIRNSVYQSNDDYLVRHEDRQYDLGELESVDFIVVPFQTTPSLGHTMLSFGFANGEQLAVSVEIRKEQGEAYSPLKGVLRQYELMYVVADERDLIQLRSIHRLDDVYVYRTRATPEQARMLFVDVMDRVNTLAARPEFYNTLTNNCTSNIRQHVNRLAPNRVPFDYREWFTGESDRWAYELGLLDTNLPFAEARERARINRLAYVYRDAPDFSQAIRR
jgi:hypothetical protein